MSKHNYLCVFRANHEIGNDVADLGQDPDFSPPVPTWGICRPQVRCRWISVGSYVVFIGYYSETRTYLLKGWFRVGEIISYPEALERFPDRRNVIIRDKVNSPSKLANMAWKRDDIRCHVQAKYGDRIPEFLQTIQSDGCIYVKNPDDNDHALDNWKCQRIFLCSKNQLRGCIEHGRCIREGKFSALKGYVVADDWQDIGPSRIPWSEVVTSSLKSKPLRTPRGQHNVIRLQDSDVEELKANILQAAEGLVI